jgi:DNA-binding SARP family transcriptional activator
MTADEFDLRFQVLGPVAAWRADTPLDLGPPRQRAVLAILLAHIGRVVSVDHLVDALWQNKPTASAIVQVQHYVSMLRRVLEARALARGVLRTHAPGYMIALPKESIDYHSFLEDVEKGRALLSAAKASEAASVFRRGLSRWHDEEPYADIALPEIRRLAHAMRQEHDAALADRIDADLACGRCTELIGELSQLVAEQPLDERLRLQLMTALHRCGRTADALGVYRSARRLFVSELGVEPGATLREMHKRILDGSAEAPVLAPGGTAATPVIPRMLPPTVPDFTGRTAERDTLLALLHSPGSRWILISGPAGIGKTALALHTAHHATHDFPHGQLFVRLRQPNGTPVAIEATLGTILTSLGFRGTAIPESISDRVNLYRSAIADRALIILADDVLDEEQARHLLPGTSRTALLMTSRGILPGLEGLRRLTLQPLGGGEARDMVAAISGGERLSAEPAASDALIAHCGGLPLALRIVAARLATHPHLSVSQLERILAVEHNRLDWLKMGDLEVRASIKLSYDRLMSEEQRLFRFLGALRAPDFPSWVANALTDDRSAKAHQLLDTLVEAHLVEASSAPGSEVRYHLHPLVQLVAAELSDSDDEGDRRAWLTRVIGALLVASDIAARAMPPRWPLDRLPDGLWKPPDNLADSAQRAPRVLLTTELSFMQALALRAVVQGDVLHGWLLAQRALYELDRHGDVDSQVRLINQVLPHVRDAGDLKGEAALLRRLGHMLDLRDRPRETVGIAQRVVEVRHQLGDLELEVEGRRLLGSCLANLGSAADARLELRRALAIARRTDNKLETAKVLYSIGCFAARNLQSGIWALRAALREAQQTNAALGDLLRELGRMLTLEGLFEEAEQHLGAARGEFLREKDHWRRATVEACLADLCVRTKRLDEAEKLLAAARPVIEKSGDSYGLAIALFTQSRLARERGQDKQDKNLFDLGRQVWAGLPNPPRGLINRLYLGSLGIDVTEEEPQSRKTIESYMKAERQVIASTHLADDSMRDQTGAEEMPKVASTSTISR